MSKSKKKKKDNKVKIQADPETIIDKSKNEVKVVIGRGTGERGESAVELTFKKKKALKNEIKLKVKPRNTSSKKGAYDEWTENISSHIPVDSAVPEKLGEETETLSPPEYKSQWCYVATDTLMEMIALFNSIETGGYIVINVDIEKDKVNGSWEAIYKIVVKEE